MKNNIVLFVDDEVNILNSIKRSVIFEDYSPMFAMDAEKAIEVVANNDISVIVSDMKMPHMNGFDLLKKIKEISPDTVRIVLSGYNQLPQILATVNSIGIFKYITKPWVDDVEFLPAIREAVNYYNLKKANDTMKKELTEKNIEYENLLKTKDELIRNTKLDVLNIKLINNSILQIQDVLFNKLKSDNNYLKITEYYLKLINGIYSKFLATFPTSIEKFNINKLAERFSQDTNNKIKFKIDNTDFSQTGNFQLILLVTTQIANYMYEKHIAQDILVQFINYPTLIIKFISSKENLLNYYNNNLEFKLIFNFISGLIETSNGKLIIEGTNNNKLVIIGNTKM